MPSRIYILETRPHWESSDDWAGSLLEALTVTEPDLVLNRKIIQLASIQVWTFLFTWTTWQSPGILPKDTESVRPVETHQAAVLPRAWDLKIGHGFSRLLGGLDWPVVQCPGIQGWFPSFPSYPGWAALLVIDVLTEARLVFISVVLLNKLINRNVFVHLLIVRFRDWKCWVSCSDTW